MSQLTKLFFHKYFSQIGKVKQALGKIKGVKGLATDSDDENDENEEEIWQALVDSRPEVEGKSDTESDLEMMDLDESEAESSLGGVEPGTDEEYAQDSDESEIREYEGFEEGGLFDDEDSSGSDGGRVFADELLIGEKEVARRDEQAKTEEAEESPNICVGGRLRRDAGE